MYSTNQLPQNWRNYPNKGIKKVKRPLPFSKEKFKIKRMGGKRVGTVPTAISSKTMTFGFNPNNVIYFSK